jgi:hypothetical protein
LTTTVSFTLFHGHNHLLLCSINPLPPPGPLILGTTGIDSELICGNLCWQLVVPPIVMILWYLKMLVCGMVGANRDEEEELEAAAVVATMEGMNRRWGGFVPGHIVKNRKRDELNDQIMCDYFNSSPLYEDELFWRRYAAPF